MSEEKPSEPVPTEMPVSVLMERHQVTRGAWSQEQWEAIAVVAGEEVVGDESSVTLVHEDGERQRYLWTGFKLNLYKDCCESYWYNLMSGNPYLFVACFLDESEEGEEELMPVLVTADQNEATGHMEIDDPVYSVPMPDTVHQWIERYVVENYVPAQKKKRKRTNWSEESPRGKAAEPDPTRTRSP